MSYDMQGVEYENRPDDMQMVCNKNFESFVIFRISLIMISTWNIQAFYPRLWKFDASKPQ